jgi:competence protein ComFB
MWVYDMQVSNVVERMVWENIDTVLSHKQMCCCPKCRADVAAFALNNLKPRYTVSQMGSTITRADILSQNVITSILVALAQAAEVVSANPRHSGGPDQ